MRAAQINEYGGTEVIKVSELAIPEVAADQVLVKVYAASLNPFDTTVRTGGMAQKVALAMPAILGGDFAGKIHAVGPDVTEFTVGDEVYGQASLFRGGTGSFAEYAVTSLSQVAKKPSNTTFNEAAAIPLVGVSAWQALVEHMQLEAGQKVLIHGGAGGIGMIAIQLAKHLGATVATTCSTKDRD